ncbi:MAG: VWA domain-containing protein [Bauldia sp.]|nr:VWA domain-containing protein [Bauldia sp.]
MAKTKTSAPATTRTATPAEAGSAAPASSAKSEIAAFMEQLKAAPVNAGPHGRLIFALDATMSRQPTWDLACRLQGEMFREAGKVGGLDVQLVYYRGFGECRASRWAGDTETLAQLMSGIDCRGGTTQIGKVLSHAAKETRKEKVSAVVFVGDAMEEMVDTLCDRAGQLGVLGVPVFLFQEGRNPEVERTFREIARLTRGAYARFDSNAAGELAALLRAVATYAAGGRKALAHHGGEKAQLLLQQLP